MYNIRTYSRVQYFCKLRLHSVTNEILNKKEKKLKYLRITSNAISTCLATNSRNGTLDRYHRALSCYSLSFRSSHRDYFRKYLFFSSRSTFFWSFPGDLMCSPNRYQFSRKVCLFAEQIPLFQELCLCVHRTDFDFPGALF